MDKYEMGNDPDLLSLFAEDELKELSDQRVQLLARFFVNVDGQEARERVLAIRHVFHFCGGEGLPVFLRKWHSTHAGRDVADAAITDG